MPESKSGALPLGDSPAETFLSARCPWRAAALICSNAAASRECRERVPRKRARRRGSRIRAHTDERRMRVRFAQRTSRTRRPLILVIRADGDARFNTAIALATPGNFCGSDGLEIVAPVTLGKDVYFRRRRGACQISARRKFPPCSCEPCGTTSASQSVGIDTGVKSSPMPARECASRHPRRRNVGAQVPADRRQRRRAST